MNLCEAFRELDALNEDTFAVSDDGIKKLAEFEQNDDLTDEISVMDLDAETEDDFSDSYVGKVILDCAVCHSKLYKSKDEIELDDEQALANVGEECPYCYSNEGFKVIGEVAQYNETDSEEPKDTDDETKDEIKLEDNEESQEENEEIDECISTSPTKDDITDAKTVSPTEKLDEAVATLERPMSAMAGTLSSAMTAHQEELASVYDRNSAIAFLDTIEPEVKNKGYLNQIKSKIETLPHRRVLQFLYNIILKGDGMGTKMESKSIKESYQSYDIMLEDDDCEIDLRTGELKVSTDVFDSFSQDSVIKIKFVEEPDVTYEYKMISTDDEYITMEQLDRYNDELPSDLYNESKSINEDVNNVNVETDDSIVNVATDDSGKVTVTTEPKKEEAEPTDQVIAPLSDETKAEIEAGSVDETEDETDVIFDDFDEEGFDELGESYLKDIYENVESYKTTNVYADDKTLKLEGIIKFNSGNEKATQFVFEAKDCTKKGKLRLIGENVQITRGNKAFTLCGVVEDKKFITESFNYNYRAKDIEGKSSRVYGTLKRSK